MLCKGNKYWFYLFKYFARLDYKCN